MSKTEQKPDIPDGITVRLDQCAAFLQPAEKFTYESQFPVAENDANIYRERYNLTEAETKILLLYRKANILTDLIRKVYDLRPDAFHVRPNRDGVMVAEEIAKAYGIEQALQVSVENIIALAIERNSHVG